MEILAPLNDLTFLDAMVATGITEVYFGFHDDTWTADFGPNACINRMSNFAQRANSIPVQQVCSAVRRIHGAGIRCYVTLNAAQYSTDQSRRIAAYLDQFQAEKPDGVIVSGPETARLVMEREITPVASTMCGIYNADIADYYYRLGVRRMIFPREVTTEEMGKICARFPDIRFEAFCMRNGCMFSDTSCLGVHSQQYGSLCAALCRSQTEIQGTHGDFAAIHAVEETSILYHEHYRHSTCGMCALYRLKKIGIHSLKIVGRADSPEAIIKDATLIRRNLTLAEQLPSEQAYLSQMEFPPNRYYMCKNGLSCYYPEIRF